MGSRSGNRRTRSLQCKECKINLLLRNICDWTARYCIQLGPRYKTVFMGQQMPTLLILCGPCPNTCDKRAISGLSHVVLFFWNRWGRQMTKFEKPIAEGRESAAVHWRGVLNHDRAGRRRTGGLLAGCFLFDFGTGNGRILVALAQLAKLCVKEHTK